MGVGLILLFLGVFVVIGGPLAMARSRGPFVLHSVRAGGVVYAVLTAAVTASTVFPLVTGGASVVSVPLQMHQLHVPSKVTFSSGPAATIVSGGVDRATLTLTGLSMPTRVLLVGGALALAAVSIVIAVALARIASAALHGEPFVPAAARSVTIAALAIALGGTLSAVLQQWGEWQAGQDALMVTAWSARGVSGPVTLADLGWPDPAYFNLQISFLPLLLGLGLLAIAAVFRAGERLQRETDGLV